ncbi:ufm1-specific protease 2 [Pelomyxa schiedti]|nr:ufm1-specific protease 2 [Pelomyxa schiedti]
MKGKKGAAKQQKAKRAVKSVAVEATTSTTTTSTASSTAAAPPVSQSAASVSQPFVADNTFALLDALIPSSALNGASITGSLMCKCLGGTSSAATSSACVQQPKWLVGVPPCLSEVLAANAVAMGQCSIGVLSDVAADLGEAAGVLPGGLEIVGIALPATVKLTNDPSGTESLDLCENCLNATKAAMLHSKRQVFVTAIVDGVGVAVYMYSKVGVGLQKVKHSIASKNQISDLLVAVKASFQIPVQLFLQSPEQPEFSSVLQSELQQITCSWHDSMSFKINDLALSTSDTNTTTPASHLRNQGETAPAKRNTKAKRTGTSHSESTVEVDTYLPITMSQRGCESPPSASIVPGKPFIRNITFHINAVAYTRSRTPLPEVARLLSATAATQLRKGMSQAATQFFFEASRVNVDPGTCVIRAYNFQPKEQCFIFSLCFPEIDVDLKFWQDYRKRIHQHFMLPLNRPLLHPKLSGLGNTVGKSLQLIDPHLQLLSKSFGKTFKHYIIEGSYQYWHYMHGMDDRGWGCAYRSMQTLCSWLILNNYTTKSIPSIPEIQQILVDLGDKEPSFAGSHQWIGAVEISMCLQYLYSVDCKVLHVSSGSNVNQYLSQLAMHFQTQGTPVMIGGGVLAYTLLGVSYDELAGEGQYLILDPHYTGDDKEGSVRDGGGVYWKGSQLFLAQNFYNFCLPQRPQIL